MALPFGCDFFSHLPRLRIAFLLAPVSHSLSAHVTTKKKVDEFLSIVRFLFPNELLYCFISQCGMVIAKAGISTITNKS
jgi:hypothetical protein